MRTSDAARARQKEKYAALQQEFIQEAERAVQFDLGEHETLRYLGYTNPRTLEGRLYKLGRTDLARAIFARLERD